MKRILSLFTAVLILISLYACQSSDGDETPGNKDEVKMINIADPNNNFVIVKSDTLEGDEKDAAVLLRNSVGDATGTRIVISSKGNSGDEADPSAYEILLGAIDRSESKAALESLSGDDGAIIKMVGTKLVIAGTTEQFTLQAVEYFLDNYLPKDGETAMNVPEDLNLRFSTEDGVCYIKYTNKGNPSAADPWIISDGGEGYYYCFAYSGISVAHVDDLDELITACDNATIVWTPESGTAYSQNIWAPELHCINGEWYIYFAADDGNNDNHRMYVLRCTGDVPTDGFEFAGQITDPSNRWAIDGTVLEYNDEMYFIWSGWDADVNDAQNLYIAHMSSPTEIDSEKVMISTPTEDWEKQGGVPYINEGPTAIVKDGKVFVTYSGSGSWCDDYCVALLTLEGDDPMDADSWVKSDKPILKKSSGTYGPGHASVAYAPDGQLWMFYHANEVSGTSWAGRSFRMEPVKKFGDTIYIGSAAEPDSVLKLPVHGKVLKLISD